MNYKRNQKYYRDWLPIMRMVVLLAIGIVLLISGSDLPILLIGGVILIGLCAVYIWTGFTGAWTAPGSKEMRAQCDQYKYSEEQFCQEAMNAFGLSGEVKYIFGEEFSAINAAKILNDPNDARMRQSLTDRYEQFAFFFDTDQIHFYSRSFSLIEDKDLVIKQSFYYDEIVEATAFKQAPADLMPPGGQSIAHLYRALQIHTRVGNDLYIVSRIDEETMNSYAQTLNENVLNYIHAQRR